MTEVFKPDNLFAGHVQPVVAGEETIDGAANAVYERGTVLGCITATSKLVLVDSTAEDGSETPYAILAGTADATTGDTKAVVYYTGEYNNNALIFGGTDTFHTHKVAARKVGIFFKDTVQA